MYPLHLRFEGVYALRGRHIPPPFREFRAKMCQDYLREHHGIESTRADIVQLSSDPGCLALLLDDCHGNTATQFAEAEDSFQRVWEGSAAQPPEEDLDHSGVPGLLQSILKGCDEGSYVPAPGILPSMLVGHAAREGEDNRRYTMIWPNFHGEAVSSDGLTDNQRTARNERNSRNSQLMGSTNGTLHLNNLLEPTGFVAIHR